MGSVKKVREPLILVKIGPLGVEDTQLIGPLGDLARARRNDDLNFLPHRKSNKEVESGLG